MKKLFSFSILVLAATFAATAQGEQYKQELDALFNSFKQKDYTTMKPLLDKNVKIGTLPTGMNDAVVPQVLKQLPVPTGYKVVKETKEGANVRIYTEYQYASGNKRAQNFVFNTDKKIVDLDILGDAQVATMSAPTAATPTNMPDRFEVPFQVRGRIIFVKAMLNGREENFILDSGAPLLILNSKYFNADTMSGARAQGVGGSAAVGRAKADTFNWHGIAMGHFDAISMDFSHLEKATHKKFKGLIGHSVFKDYAMTYDYKRKVITFEKNGTAANGTPICVVPMKMTAHIPIIPVTISGKTYKMGIDCGASTNLLYAKYLPELGDNVGKKHKQKLSGAGQEKIKAVYAKVKKASCDKAEYTNMHFAFEDGNLEQLNAGYNLGIDGLVGYEFLKRYKTTVDYIKNEVRIYSFD